MHPPLAPDRLDRAGNGGGLALPRFSCTSTQTAAAFLKLPQDFVQETVGAMQTLDIHCLHLQAKSICLSFRPSPKRLPDLVGTVRSGLSLMERACAVLAGASPETRLLPKKHTVAPVRCSYCHGCFFR